MEDREVVYQDVNTEVLKQGEYLELNYKTPHLIRIKASDRQAMDDEVIRMLRMRSPEGQKYFVQKEVGKIIGVSRQMINRRWQVYRQEGLLALLAGEWEKSKITPALLDRLAEIVVENPFLFEHEIKERLQEEGVCGEISEATLYSALRKMDGRNLIMLMREKASKSVPEAFMEAGYIIERLFGIIDDLFIKVSKEAIDHALKQGLEYLRSYFRQATHNRTGPTEKDKYTQRKKLGRDKKRKIWFLKYLLSGMRGIQECPDCHSREIKFFFKRERGYKDKKGEKIQSYSRVYQCLNRQCRTKYFTRPPDGVELYSRVHRDVKKMTLRWIFHLRGSLSRVRDELKEHGIEVALTTVLRWIKKAGEECVNALSLFRQEDWEQPLCIDEKWIKIRNEWCYVFTAVGTKVTDLLAVELFYHKDKQAMRTFLYQLKALGFRPESITTDLLMGYESVVKEVFPDCLYLQCVLHAGRDAKRIVRKALPAEEDEEWKERLTKRIRTLFKSKNIKQVKKRYFKIMQLREQAPDSVSGVFNMLQKYYPKLCLSVQRKDIPKTTNPVERAIGEFEERYQLTKGFTSFYYAQFFIKAYQIYYRLRKISFGRFRGKSRLELKGNPVGKLSFADFLTPTFC
ncbi:MAG: DDE-type integrase/transposase/recombinase [Candidatus Aminicenantaceae bacterium]